MLMPSHQNYDSDHDYHGNDDNDQSWWKYEQQWLFSYDIENKDDHHGRTKESCRTLYWRFWLGKPGQRGVQIGFEKARAHIWALDARPPEYPMPHKAPAVMESDIEWYKAIHVFTGLRLLDHLSKQKTVSSNDHQMRLYKPVKAAGHTLTCICND